MITGASAGNQTLSLQDEKGATVCQLLDDAAMLGAYPVVDFYTLFVTVRAVDAACAMPRA